MNKTNIRPITENQGRVLMFINQSIADAGFPPTYREIMDALNFSSTNAVSGHLMALETKGYITTLRGRARAMALTEKAKQFIVDINQWKTKTN